MASDASGPAFPTWHDLDPDNNEQTPGLTKRELFAGLAMAGMYQNTGIITDHTFANIGEWSVKQADALLAELAKEPRR